METTLAAFARDGWGWWWIFPLAWIALIALFWTFAWRGPWRRRAWEAPSSPEAVLGERYARGEIDEQEYRTRLSVLRERR
ncbi:MAG TPA: SHOCT domain-containing protein [Actinomycetota bacterium]